VTSIAAIGPPLDLAVIANPIDRLADAREDRFGFAAGRHPQ
jgi:hypothetical protein